MKIATVAIIMTLGFVGALADTSPPTGEDEILPEEVIITGSDWNDSNPWGGNPPMCWYEDPQSVSGIWQNQTNVENQCN